MLNASARLARSITWASSKQSYLTALFLADRDLVDDCLRAYAYFRWADDMIDIGLDSLEARAAFIARQKNLIDKLYKQELQEHLCAEEQMLADLIAHDRGVDKGLRSFIRNFMAVIEFDCYRLNRPVSRRELAAYTTCLSTAVMDGLLYFIGNGHAYPRNPARLQSVTGAHITHMLRDTLEDLPRGVINIPAEEIDSLHIDLAEPEGEPFRGWVKGQVAQARLCLREGRAYIDSLDVLRARLAGEFYCARFDCVLNAIEREGFILRAEYPERHCPSAWLKMVSLAFSVLANHVIQQLRKRWRGGLASLSSNPSLHS